MIIAEIGQNFMGDMSLATALIRLAKDNEADLVKFQLYDSRKLYGEYQETELTKEQAFGLFDYGREIGIEIFFSVFDIERVKWCEEMSVKRYKIASRMRDIDVLRAIEETGKPVIASIDPNVDATKLSCTILFCLSEYPASVSFKYLDFPYGFQGFSDHTIGLDAAKIALARGAQIIEKHFCIDHHTGVDAEWSITPEELKELKRFEKVCKEVL